MSSDPSFQLVLVTHLFYYLYVVFTCFVCPRCVSCTQRHMCFIVYSLIVPSVFSNTYSAIFLTRTRLQTGIHTIGNIHRCSPIDTMNEQS